MLRAQDRLPDVERRCLGVAVLVVIESDEVVEARVKVLALAPEPFLTISKMLGTPSKLTRMYSSDK